MVIITEQNIFIKLYTFFSTHIYTCDWKSELSMLALAPGEEVRC